MEGKNCFRTKWSQTPLYSGGNIASLLLPRHESLSSLSSSLPSSSVACRECLVTACGDTVNVLDTNSGALIASYGLPLEDVILCVDAVTVAAPSAGSVANSNNVTSENAKAQEEEGNKSLVNRPSNTSVPPGSYIAVGTRALQVYVLRLDIAEKHKNEVESATDAALSDGNKGIVSSYTLTLLRSWTAAQQAIAVVQFTFNGRYLVSGSTDGGVKIWDVFNHHLTHNLHIPSTSLVHSVYVDILEKYVCIGSFEGYVTIFDFVTKKMISHGRIHVSAVEALCLTPDSQHLFSIGRDRKFAICTLATPELHELRGIVVKEHVSSAVFESPFCIHIGAVDGTVSTYIASVTGPLQLLRRLRGFGLDAKGEASDEELAIRSLLVAQTPKGLQETGLLYESFNGNRHSSSLYAADASFNIAFLVPNAEGASYRVSTTLVGYLDQVLDLKLFPPGFNFQRVVVTNSKEVRCYSSSGCLSAQTLRGHKDTVLTCAVSADGRVIATAGKDCDIRFWSTVSWETIATGQGGHEMDISSIVFNAKQSDSYMLLFSTGADENLRLWDVGTHVIPLLIGDRTESTNPPITFTYHTGISAAHEGLIYTAAVSPNDQYLATAGKDKKINLWTITGKKIYRDASLNGHRRAVSSLVFSPTDRLLASASNDGSVRLWSLVSLTCVKAFQIDRIPVLQVAFFNGGTQLVTGNAEGVLRVWAIAASEVVWSGETHEDRIWTLSVVERENEAVLFISGSADGVLVTTEDYTLEESERVRSERHDVILKEQKLANALRMGKHAEAFLLALKLNHPRNLRQVIVKWSAKDPQGCEESMCHSIIPALDDEQLLRLLQFTREWVTNARHCGVASLVVHSLLAAHHFTTLVSMPAIKSILEALLAYMRRHSQRLHEMLQRTYYIDYLTRSLASSALTTQPPFLCAASSLGVELAVKRPRDEVSQV